MNALTNIVRNFVDQRRAYLQLEQDSHEWLSRDPILASFLPILWWSEQRTLFNTQPTAEPWLEVGKQEYLKNLLAFGRCKQALVEITTAAQQAQIPLIILKGIWLVEHLYPNAGLRKIGDLDLLVPYAHRKEMGQLLQGMGWQPRLLNGQPHSVEWLVSTKLEKHWQPGEWTFINQSGIAVDLHWHLVPAPWLRSSYQVSIDEIWQAAVPTSIQAISGFSALRQDHLLIYLCLHLAQHGLQSLRHLLDVDQLLRKVSTDKTWSWVEVVECSSRWQARSAVYHVLHFCQQLFATPIPASVLAALDPGWVAKRRLRCLLTAQHLLESTPVAWGQRYPGLVKASLLDAMFDIARLIGLVVWPDSEWRRYRYSGNTRLYHHWKHSWNVIIRGDS